jgi:hypothetical protein
VAAPTPQPRRGAGHGRQRRNRSRLAPRSEVASAATDGGGVVRARPRWRTGHGQWRISARCLMECPLGKHWPRRLHRRPAALLARRGGSHGGDRVPRMRLQLRRAPAPRPPGRCASSPLAASSLFRSDAIGLSFRVLFCCYTCTCSNFQLLCIKLACDD